MKTLLAGLIMIAGLASAEVKTNQMRMDNVKMGVVVRVMSADGAGGHSGAGGGYWRASSNYCDTYSISTMQSEGVITNVINELAKAGEICKVFGHSWRGGRPGEGPMFFYADYHPGTTYRTCRICGVCESQSLTDWE